MLGRRVGQQIAAARDPTPAVQPDRRPDQAADLTVGNLECALSRNGRPTQGGDSFGADASSLAGMRNAGFDVLVQGQQPPRRLRTGAAQSSQRPATGSP